MPEDRKRGRGRERYRPRPSDPKQPIPFTELELKGYGHYVPAEKRTVFLYAQPQIILPAWFSRERLGLSLVVTRTSLFPSNSDEGFFEWSERDFSIRISSPERAAMEMLYLVPQKISFEESLLIMESLVTLRPEVVQKLLEMYRFVKVDRPLHSFVRGIRKEDKRSSQWIIRG